MASLLEMLHAFWQADPVVPGLFPDRECWRRKVRIRKCTDRDAIVIGSDVRLPKDRTAAVGAEMEGDLSSFAGVVCIPLIGAFYSHLRFVEVSAGVDDRPRSALTRFAVTDIHHSGFAGHGRAKKTAVALRYSFHSRSHTAAES